MMASQSNQLALPRRIPSMARFGADCLTSRFAIYTLVDVDQSSLNSLVETADTPDEDFQLTRLAPSPNFAGKTLQDIANAHMELAESQGAETESPPYNPHTFIVVTEADWTEKGIVVVSLNYDAEGGVAAMRLPAKEVAAKLLDVEIANSDWEELHEEAMEEIEQPEDILVRPGEEDDDADGDGAAHEEPSRGWTRDLGHFCAYRAVTGVRMPMLMQALNGSLFGRAKMEEWPCRIPPWNSFVNVGQDVEAGLREIHRHHTEHSGGEWNQNFVAVADLASWETDGIVVGRLEDIVARTGRRVMAREAADVLVEMARGT